MSNFKIKKKKKEKLDFINSTTLDKKHQEYSQMFFDQKNEIDDKYNKILELESTLQEIEVMKNNNTLTDDTIELKATVLNELDSLKSQINDINNSKEEIDYYDKIGEIVCDYYQLRDGTNNEFQESKNIIEWLGKRKI